MLNNQRQYDKGFTFDKYDKLREQSMKFLQKRENI